MKKFYEVTLTEDERIELNCLDFPHFIYSELS